MPVLAELKRALEAAHSPLLGELLATLRTLLRDHKAEVGPWREGRLHPLCLHKAAGCPALLCSRVSLTWVLCGLHQCKSNTKLVLPCKQPQSVRVRLLEGHGPLLTSVLCACGRQIRDILAGDKQLADELLYDLKQDERARAAAAAAAAAPAQPAARLPGGALHPATAADGAGGRSGGEGVRMPAGLPVGTGRPHSIMTCRVCTYWQQSI